MPAPAPPGGVTLTRAGDVWTIRSDRMRVVLSRGGPLDLPQGRSKHHTLLLSFIGGDRTPQNGTQKRSNVPHQAPQGVAAKLGALAHEQRATVDPQWLAHAGEFDQDKVLPFGQHVRIESNLRSLMWLDMPWTKFDVGDTESHYNASYAVNNEDLVPPLAGAPAVPRVEGGGSVKFLTMAYRGWTRMLGHAQRNGLLDAHEYPSVRKLNHAQ